MIVTCSCCKTTHLTTHISHFTPQKNVLQLERAPNRVQRVFDNLCLVDDVESTIGAETAELEVGIALSEPVFLRQLHASHLHVREGEFCAPNAAARMKSSFVIKRGRVQEEAAEDGDATKLRRVTCA